MTGRQKIEWLTNSWYGYELVTGVVAILRGGFGLWSLFWNGVGIAFGLLITYWIGKSLLGRSALTRSLLAIVSVISIILGALFLAGQAWFFFASWKVGMLFGIGLTLAGLTLNIRSYRVLTDSSVKAYIGG